MPGPTPKDPSVRARRNKSATRAALHVHDRAIPDLPERPAGWHPMTEQWWSDVWASPMSPEWDESDRHNVVVLAMIHDDMWRAETARDRKEAAAEFRQQRRDLGLSPMARRSLEWSIEQAEEAKDKGQRRRTAPRSQHPAKGDPRGILRAL